MTLNLPDDFIQSVSCCPGFDKDAFITAHLNNSPTSIRVNPFKQTQLNFTLNKAVAWNKYGFYLNERPNFTHDLLFQAGCYYVQEAGSMFIQHALTSHVDFNETILALDVCASPGGKSTLLASLLNEKSALVANEVVKQRAEVLSQNLTKWGNSNVVVTNNDPASYSAIPETFDLIMVDAPCSGSGLFRKQPDAINEWSLENVNLCSQRQKRILSDILGSLKSGGTLVYSTCSYSIEENENIVNWLISEFGLISLPIPIEANWGIVETHYAENDFYGYRFYPDKTQSEGFFCSLLKKPGASNNHRQFRKSKFENFTALKAKEKEVFNDWIHNPEVHLITKFKEDFLLTNELVMDFINKYPQLYFKKVGTTIGNVIKKEVIPHHDLALSIHRSSSIQTIVCNREEGLQFFKKSLVTIEGQKGWNLLTFNGFGLGWIKHLGNRINNYLPNDLRVLK
ncbi:MAG: methyltransferase [Bacteroidota bacterium]|jgi:16S rRNA C967 or C1407 C5-methylase (RsmB/RsmF family)/NOL1/NOP2/fmu family ribosome biogenesis protein|nr:methyltransferase [Bacteroidota bacterium]